MNLFRRLILPAVFALFTCALPAPSRAGSEVLGAVSVAGVRVKGLTPTQARQKVEHALAVKLNQPLILTDGIKRVSRKRRELGMRIDVETMIGHAKAGQKKIPVQFTVDPHLLRVALRHMAARFAAPARNAKILEQHGAVTIWPGQSARAVNIEATATHLVALLEAHGATRVLHVLLIKTPPHITAANLKGINGRLSRFSTTFNPDGKKRTHNIRVAVAAINGRVVPPGQVFSLNETLGERTHQHGYLQANVIVNGKLTPGIGGGVSQVTGTLFNAVLLAGLPILEYGTHAHPIPYIPIGRDATLAWNHIDLKFKNSTHAPLYIAYTATGNHAITTLYGARTPGQHVTLSVASKKLSARHLTAVLYRKIKVNGKIVRQEKIGRSDYKWQADYSE